jgi:hypothetical protein
MADTDSEEERGEERGVPDEILAAIRKKAIEEVSKYTVLAIVGFITIAGTGWWLYLKPKLADSFGGVPVNAVIAFDTASGCSQLGDAWEELKDAAGRVIVATGKGDDLTSRGFRERSGKERYRLYAENLPPHMHQVYKHAGQIVGDTGVPGAGSGDPNKSSEVNAGLTGNGPGHSEPYEVMPPYISLYFCKKIRQ